MALRGFHCPECGHDYRLMLTARYVRCPECDETADVQWAYYLSRVTRALIGALILCIPLAIVALVLFVLGSPVLNEYSLICGIAVFLLLAGLFTYRQRWSVRIVSYVYLFVDLVKEMFIIVGNWIVYTMIIFLMLYGIFTVMGMVKLDFILILWASVITSSIFAVPYEEYWDLKRFRMLFGVSACLVITSFALLAASILIQNLFAYRIGPGYVIPGIFVSGVALAMFTRDYWDIEKLQSIKNLSVYGILGESLLLYLGDTIAGMQNVDPWVRGIFLIAAIVIIAVLGIAVIKIYHQ